jgi:hypothetical protein
MERGVFIRAQVFKSSVGGMSVRILNSAQCTGVAWLTGWAGGGTGLAGALARCWRQSLERLLASEVRRNLERWARFRNSSEISALKSFSSSTH